MLSQDTRRISKAVHAKDLNVSYFVVDFEMWPHLLVSPLGINTIYAAASQ